MSIFINISLINWFIIRSYKAYVFLALKCRLKGRNQKQVYKYREYQYNKRDKSYIYIYIKKKKRHRSAGVDVNMNSKNENGVESKEDKSMNHDRFAISLHTPKLHIPVVSWQLK